MNDYSIKLHEKFMQKALELAKEALEVGEVPIGCVIVDIDGAILAKGRNRTNETKNATRHAEFEALELVLNSISDKSEQDLHDIRDKMKDLTLYVTVEPCIMCAAALRKVGLTRIYFGCQNDRFGGCGSIISAHTDYIDHKVDPPLDCIILKEFRKECVELLRHFYLKENNRAPNPRKKAKRMFKPVEEEEATK